LQCADQTAKKWSWLWIHDGKMEQLFGWCIGIVKTGSW
jgi:hypothetical protein